MKIMSLSTNVLDNPHTYVCIIKSEKKNVSKALIASHTTLRSKINNVGNIVTVHV